MSMELLKHTSYEAVLHSEYLCTAREVGMN